MTEYEERLRDEIAMSMLPVAMRIQAEMGLSLNERFAASLWKVTDLILKARKGE